eukprot:UN1315
MCRRPLGAASNRHVAGVRLTLTLLGESYRGLSGGRFCHCRAFRCTGAWASSPGCDGLPRPSCRAFRTSASSSSGSSRQPEQSPRWASPSFCSDSACELLRLHDQLSRPPRHQQWRRASACLAATATSSSTKTYRAPWHRPSPCHSTPSPPPRPVAWPCAWSDGGSCCSCSAFSLVAFVASCCAFRPVGPPSSGTRPGPSRHCAPWPPPLAEPPRAPAPKASCQCPGQFE